MRMKMICVLCSMVFLMFCISSGYADASQGDIYTFCPAISTSFYNDMLKNFLELNDTQSALLQVSSDGRQDGNLTYSDLMDNTIFIFGGAESEYDTGVKAFIYCSLKENSTLKNIPMIIWVSQVQRFYYGELKETGSSFLEWINEDRKDGDTFTSPYFLATYKEEPFDYCSLLLVKR